MPEKPVYSTDPNDVRRNAEKFLLGTWKVYGGGITRPLKIIAVPKEKLPDGSHR